MKIFNTRSKEVATSCVEMFNFPLPSVCISNRKSNFLRKLSISDNIICRLQCWISGLVLNCAVLLCLTYLAMVYFASFSLFCLFFYCCCLWWRIKLCVLRHPVLLCRLNCLQSWTTISTINYNVVSNSRMLSIAVAYRCFASAISHTTWCFKKVAPLKLFGIFSLRLSLFAWNSADLLAVHTHIYLPISVDLS